MTAHPDINKIAFTGSTGTGRHVMRSAADTTKRLYVHEDVYDEVREALVDFVANNIT